MWHHTDNVFTNIELTGDNMAIFGNFKGTTKSEFQIGKTGNKINTGTEPVAGENGDLYVDSANTSLKVYTGSEWTSIGTTLTELNVDEGTLFVNSANDTVSIGSTSSNEKLFVNGNLRLGTNPSLQFSGAYLDVNHSNGTTTQVRVRDNTSNTDPVFKVFNANNASEVFKVQGSTIRINDAYNLPTGDGTADQVLKTDGSGNLSFATVSANPGGANTDIQFNDGGSFSGTDALTFDKQTSTLETGVVKGVIFEPITDYGTIDDTANMTIDYGSVTDPGVSGDFEYLADTFGPTSDSFSVNGLPSASQPGQMIYVSDETGGATMAFSDGTNWRRITDRAVVS